MVDDLLKLDDTDIHKVAVVIKTFTKLISRLINLK